MDPYNTLTPRQLELLRLYATGLTARQVGEQLGISHQTVRKHLDNAYLRIDIHTRAEAAAHLEGRNE